MKSPHLFLRALTHGDLRKTLIVSYNSSTTFLFVYQGWTKRVRKILRQTLDRVVEHPLGYRCYLLIYLIPKLLFDGQCWGGPSSVLQLVWQSLNI